MNSQVYLAHRISAGRTWSDRDHAQLRELELARAERLEERGSRSRTWWLGR